MSGGATRKTRIDSLAFAPTKDQRSIRVGPEQQNLNRSAEYDGNLCGIFEAALISAGNADVHGLRDCAI